MPATAEDAVVCHVSSEIDPDKAAWLRELIRVGIVAQGEVDERSIADIRLDDLRGFTQCHFFAGIGVWSYALRLAGWPDDRPVWTGSCPCPSFSAAGKGGGFTDPRHLWPDWARLIGECKPATVFGEQADDAIGYGWLDLVQTDLERENYAVGKAVLGACSVGAPHIRQRLYFVAHAETAEAVARSGEVFTRAGTHHANRFGIGGNAGRLEHANLERLGETRSAGSGSGAGGDGASGELADANSGRFSMHGTQDARERLPQQFRKGDVGESISEGLERHNGNVPDGNESRWFGAQPDGSTAEAGHVNGFWRDADWILRKRWNRDDWEWCPTEPGTFPLAHGAAARVLRLRGYGDAICAQIAEAFIAASTRSIVAKHYGSPERVEIVISTDTALFAGAGREANARAVRVRKVKRCTRFYFAYFSWRYRFSDTNWGDGLVVY